MQKRRFRNQRRFGNQRNDLRNLRQRSKKMRNQLRFRDQKNNKSQHTRPHPTLFHARYIYHTLSELHTCIWWEMFSHLILNRWYWRLHFYMHPIKLDVGFEINGLWVLEPGHWTSWFLDSVWYWFLNGEIGFQNFGFWGRLNWNSCPKLRFKSHVSKKTQVWNWLVHWHQIFKCKLLKRTTPLRKHIPFQHALQRDFRPSARPSCFSGKYSQGWFGWSCESTVTTSQTGSRRQFRHVSEISVQASVQATWQGEITAVRPHCRILDGRHPKTCRIPNFGWPKASAKTHPAVCTCT